MSDAEVSNGQIRQDMATAEFHFNRGEWEQALAFFDRVLQLDRQHKVALDGRRKAMEKLDRVADIRGRLAEGRRLLEASQYGEANQVLNEAQDIGATNGVLEYHAEIRALRDRAQEALLWRGVVDSQLEQARQFEEKGDIDAAIVTLRELLPKLTANGQEELGQAARTRLSSLLLRREVDDQVQEAQQAYDEQDFERASQIAEDLSVRYPDRVDVKRYRDRFSKQWNYLHTQLQGAQESLAAGWLDDAVAMLRQVRHNMPKNPNWQALWLRAYSSHGHELMAQARAALLQQDFAEADRLAAEAMRAFAAVLEVFPGHEPSERATQELHAWRTMTATLQQVRRDEVALQLDAAQGMLASARVNAETAKAAVAGSNAGSAYADIEGLLNSIDLRLSTARQRINDARNALRDGLAAMEQKRIDRAEEYFRRGLDSLGDLPEDILEKELRSRRQQAIEVRDANLRLLQEAGAQESAGKCIALLQQVYDAWPTAPGMPAALGDKLLAEAETALRARQNERAAQCARQATALALLPDDMRERAQNLLDQVDCSNQVQTAVSEALRRHRSAREGGALPPLDEYRAIGDLLADAQGSAQRNCHDKMEVVTAALAEIQPMSEALGKAWPSIERARAAQGQGDWSAAAELYAAAAGAMGSLCPAALQGEAKNAERTGTELQVQIDAAVAALHKAQGAYQAGESGKLVDIQWETLFTEISLCLPAIAKSKKMAEPAPAAVSDLERTCSDLQTRARLLREVFEHERSGKTTEALGTLKVTAERFPNDTVMAATLQVMRTAYSAATRARAQEILDEVDAFAARGEWQNALDKLAQATELELSPSDIERARQRVIRQQGIWDGIWERQRQAELMKAQNSRVDAQHTYSEAILMASLPDSGLDAELRNLLLELRRLFGELIDAATLPAKGESLLKEAREKYERINRIGAANQSMLRFFAFVRDWFDVSVLCARSGFIRSVEHFGKNVETYAVAKEQLREAFGDSQIAEMVEKLQATILGEMASSLDKRMDRADNNAARGNFEKALADLASIDEEFINSVKPFPEIVNADTIQQKLQSVTLMETKLLKLQQRAARMEPMLEAISKAYVSGNLDEAERLIMEAEVIDVERTARYLWEQIDSTHVLIRKRRQEMTVSDLDDLLVRVRVRLDTDESLSLAELRTDVLGPLETNLAKMRSLDKGQWGERQQEYDTLLARTRERMRHVQEVDLAWQTAQDYIKAEAWEEAVAALERSLSMARGHRREEIQRGYANAKPKAETQRQRREAIETGKRNLTMRRFTNAIDAFANAMKLDAPSSEIQPFLAAAQAGDYLERARGSMVTDPNAAERLLQDAIRSAGSAEPAQELKKEAQEDLAQITKRQAHAASIAQLMRVAEGALMENKLKEAGEALDDILQLDQGHPSAQELRRKVNEALQSQALVGSAESLYAEKRYREAIELAEQSLKIYPLLAANELLVKLRTEQDAGEALTRAQSLAQEGRFFDARSELQSARDKNPNHPGLPEAQRAISDMQEWFTTRVKKPVDDAYKQQRYRDALRAAENALKTVDLPELRNELQGRQQTILETWTRQLATEAQQLLNQPSEQDSDSLLARCAEQINDALSFAEAAPARLQQEMRSLANRLEVRRSLLRLVEGQKLLDAPNPSTHDLRRCEQIAREVLQINETLKDFELGWKAMDFQGAVEDRKQSVLQADRDTRLEGAREQLARAKSAADLELARQRANEVLSLPNFANDPGVKALLTQIEEEGRRLRTTSDRLENARRSLRNGNYSGAKDTLEMIDEPSRLLRDELARLIDLTADLIEADDKEATDPQRAMEIYEAAEASGYDLGLTILNAKRRCRANALAQLEQDLSTILLAPLPDVAAAQGRLQQVRERGWAQNAEQEQRVAQLEALVSRKARLVIAIQLLEQGADAEEAVKTLEDVRRSQPQGGDAVDEGWLAVAQAVAALNSGRLDEAQRLLQMTPPVLRPTALVARVQTDLAQAQQTAQQYSAAAAQLDQLLGTGTPDFAAAVQVARSMPANASLTRRVRAALEQAMEASSSSDNYARVRQLGEHLHALLPADEAAGELLRQAEAQRTQKLEDALAAAEAALAQDDVNTAERLLTHAQKLDIDRSMPRIETLQGRLRQRQPVLDEMAQCVSAAREAMRASDHRAAVTAALQAQRHVQQHAAVKQLFADLRASLHTAIDQHVAANSYYLALQGCDLALELGQDSAFTTLRSKVAEQRRAALDQAVAHANEALARFDMETAQRAVVNARTIQNDDPRVERLERQLGERQQAAPKLRKAMEEGWDAIRRRDLAEAASQFREAALNAPDFEEPLLWRSYTANFQQALAYVEDNQDEAAANSLAQAEMGLRYAGAQSLSTLWGTRLEQERRRGVYYALRVRRQVEEMIAVRRQADAAKAKAAARSAAGATDPETLGQATQLVNRLTDMVEGFAGFAHAVFEPGPDFDATFAADGPASAGQPPKVAPATTTQTPPATKAPAAEWPPAGQRGTLQSSDTEAVPGQKLDQKPEQKQAPAQAQTPVQEQKPMPKPEPPRSHPPMTEESTAPAGQKPATQPPSQPEPLPARPAQPAAPDETATSNPPAAPKRPPGGTPPASPEPPVQDSSTDSRDFDSIFGGFASSPVD